MTMKETSEDNLVLCTLMILADSLAPWSYAGINLFGYAGRKVLMLSQKYPEIMAFLVSSSDGFCTKTMGLITQPMGVDESGCHQPRFFDI